MLQRADLQLTLTGAVPGRDLDQHPEEELSLGHAEGLLLVLLLSEEHQAVALFRRAMDLHRRHFTVLLKLVKEPVFQTRI